MKCHRPWNENLKCYFRTELCIGCCAVWQLCCSPKSHSRTPVLATSISGLLQQQKHFDLCQWFSDQAKETYKCITMIAGEHHNAFDISLFRKPWDDWECSNGGPKNSRSAVSRLAWGWAMCWLTWKAEQRGAQQDLSPHTCWQLSVAVYTACFCVS